MSTYSKDFIMDKFRFIKFPSESFSEEIGSDWDFIITDSPQKANGWHQPLSSSFLPQDENQKPKNKWRKHSEGERKGESSSASKSLKEMQEVDLFINRAYSTPEYAKEDFALRPQTKNNNQNKIEDKLTSVLSLVKTSKKKNRRQFVKNILQINEILNYPEDFPLWYLNCKVGLGLNYDLILGPLTSYQIIEYYEDAILDDLTVLRLCVDSTTKDWENLNGKDFKLGDLCKVWGLQDIYNKMRKVSSNNDELYFNHSLYNNLGENKQGGNRSTKNAKKKSLNYDNLDPSSKNQKKRQTYNENYDENYYYEVCNK